MGTTRRPAGELESMILAALWTAGRPMTPAEVLASVDADLAYTTVMTTLARLYDKDLLRRRRAGRAYRYEPVPDVAVAAADQMRRLLDRGDHATVLARFVGTLNEDDERVLTDLLRPQQGRRRRT